MRDPGHEARLTADTLGHLPAKLRPHQATAGIITNHINQYVVCIFRCVPSCPPGPVMAGTVLTMLPILVVFLILQRHMIKGLTSGAVKG